MTKAFVLLTLTCLTAPWSMAEDCGTLVSGVATPEVFEIDRPTSQDLNLMSLVYPVVGKSISTQFGEARLKYLLTHPLLDREAILQRQNAVQFLIQNQELRAQLKTLLMAIHKSGAEETEQNIAELKVKDSKSTIFGHLPTAISLSLLTSAAISSFFDHHLALSIARGGMFYIYLGGANQTAQTYTRSRLVPLRSVFDLTTQMAAPLAQSRSPILQQLGADLMVTVDPRHPQSISKVSRSVLRMLPRIAADFGDLFVLTNSANKILRSKVVKNRDAILRLLAVIGELDALVALAELQVQDPAHYIFPTILPLSHPTYLKIEEGHHPVVLADVKTQSVTNTLEIAAPNSGLTAPGFYLLTGPNTGGKSTYLRMISIATILAQIGAPVPATSMELTPVALMTNMNVQDALDKKQSFFYAQAARVAEILERTRTQKHALIVMDEILNGTSPEEHTALEWSIIRYLIRTQTPSILATHDRKLQSLEVELPGVVNIHVDEKGQQSFTVKSGPSLFRNAIQVTRDAGLPAEITSEAEAYLSQHQ